MGLGGEGRREGEGKERTRGGITRVKERKMGGKVRRGAGRKVGREGRRGEKLEGKVKGEK